MEGHSCTHSESRLGMKYWNFTYNLKGMVGHFRDCVITVRELITSLISKLRGGGDPAGTFKYWSSVLVIFAGKQYF